MRALGSKKILAEYVTWSRGTGPLVVLLHGWPVCSHHWRYLMEPLEEWGFCALAIDLKGLGESTSKDDAYEKVVIAKEILQLVEAKTFCIVGHDWGGSIALAMAALAPDRVSRLVLEEEMAPGLALPLQGESSARYPTWHGDLHRVKGLAEDLILGREDRYINFFLDLRASSASLAPEDCEHYLSHCRDEAKTAAMLAYYRSREADARFFCSLERAQLALPILAIGGRLAMGAAVADAAKRVAPLVTGIVLHESGHYPAEEQPAKFNLCVEKFLRS